MNYKIQGAINKNKKTFIIAIVLWVFIAIVLIPPIAYSFFGATYEGGFNFDTLINIFINFAIHPFKAFQGLTKFGGMGTYFKTLIIFTFIYSIFAIIGVIRTAPKNEYEDIEHGSSDWSQNGEQYQILSRNKGIILAEDNYLPVDKRGNVNVLVVGRFWFW
ncbi:MAG: hypothetical protein IKF17_03485 [Clostridia bacterium]|nr:hypothetical protein [Clostridia bacterium]